MRNRRDRSRPQCCLFSEPPKHLDVSRCQKHDRIELWVNHVAYVLTEGECKALGLALIKAAANVGGMNEPAGDLR